MNEDQQNDNPEPEFQPSEPSPPVLDNSATRQQRFLAALIDGFLGMMVSMPLFNHYGLWESMKTDTALPMDVQIKLTLFGLMMFFVMHGPLLYKYGQTVGKRVMGIAIVTLNGQRPAFAHLILNRYLPQWVAGFVPGIGPLLGVIDALFVFRDDKRCVHDLIAGTKVIDTKKNTTPDPNSLIL